MWPLLGPIEYNQVLPSAKSNHTMSDVRMVNIPSKTAKIISNIQYIDSISSTCLALYTIILLLLCALPIFALNIYLRQAFASVHQTNKAQFDD
ncbi:unnamed protein product [Rotaria socialis]|uniref:Uncharacterized protein n=1 Tax=Rotaria socialis TaxID=392032 RepID=A0A818DFK0_9BILA|nr:unnamed protein product [Rotaria socialis]